jgi:hypothetical protein
MRTKRLVLAVLLVAGGGLVAFTSNAASPPPYATTVEDLCPGAPDPCVVTEQFLVADGASFNFGGRALQLSTGAKLLGDSGASFTLTNTASVDFKKGAVVSAPGNGGNAGTITIESSGDCSFSGQILANATQSGGVGGNGGYVPITCGGTMTFGPSSLTQANGVGGEGGTVEPYASAVSVAKGARLTATGTQRGGWIDIEHLPGSCTINGLLTASSVFTAAHQGYGPDGGSVDVLCEGISLGKGSKILANGAGGDGGMIFLGWGTGAFSSAKGTVISANGKSYGGDVGIYGTSCDINSRVLASGGVDRNDDAGYGGEVDINCDDVSVGVGSVIKAKAAAKRGPDFGAGGGIVTVEATTGDINIAKGTTIDARGVADQGGVVSLTSAGDCQIAAKIKANTTVKGELGYWGEFTADCGGDFTLGTGGGIVVATSPYRGFVTTSIVAGGSVTLAAGTRIRNDGGGPDAAGKNAIEIDAGTTCAIDGWLQSRSFDNGQPIIMTCPGGFSMASTGGVLGDGIGGTAGGVTVTSSAGACTINGVIKAKGFAGRDLTDPYSEAQPGYGGVVEVTCATGLTVETLKVRKPALIDVSAYGGAYGSNSCGGWIKLAAAAPGVAAPYGPVLMNGTLLGKGSGLAGYINIEGCDVTVGDWGKLNTNANPVFDAWAGINDIYAHGTLSISGFLLAVAPRPRTVNDGGNYLQYGVSYVPPADPATQIRPEATVTSGLSPCS